MKRLQLTFKRGEYVYYQISRQDNVALYEISNQDGEPVRLELVKIKLAPRFLNGKIEHEETYGKVLHTFKNMSETKAMKIFAEITGVNLLEKKKKPRNQASYDARRDNSNRKIFDL